MSKKVDERVVEMRFDNAQFERNVSTSMSTLDKLKKSLNLDGAAKSLENVNTAAKSVSFDNMASSVAALESRFSTLGIVGMRVIENLTDSMMGLAKKTLNFFTSGVIQGGIKRAMNLENAHFQLQGLLKDEEAVSAVMKNVNDSVDGTAYSLDSAATVASQLAASGLRAGDQMFKSLRAVAGVAAMTNSSYDDIGRIFTQVAGQGRLMGQDLLQLSSRGMNAAATLATYLHKSEAEVRDMVSKGQISFEIFAAAMDDAFGEHAKKANETFTGALSNIKAALARIGALFVSPLIEQNGAMVKFFNTVRERINEVKKQMEPLADSFTKGIIKIVNVATKYVSKINITDRFKIFSNLIETIKNVFKGLGSVIKPIGQAFKDIFLPIDTKGIISFTEGLAKFTSKLKLSASASEKLKSTFKGLFSIIDIGWTAVKAVVSGAVKLFGKLTGLFTGFNGGILTATGAIGDWLSGVRDSIKESNIFSKAVNGIVNVLGSAIDALKKFGSYIKGKFKASGFETFLDVLNRIWGAAKKVGAIVVKVASSIGKALGDALRNGDIKSFLETINVGVITGILMGIKKWVDKLKKSIPDVSSIKELLGTVKNSLVEWQKSIKTNVIKNIAISIGILAAALWVLSGIDPDKLGSALTAITVLFGELIGALKAFDKLGTDLKGVGKAATLMISMSIAVVILASALKKLSTLDWNGIGKGLTGVLGLMSMLTGAMIALSKFAGESQKIFSINKKGLFSSKSQKNLISIGLAMIAMATAIKILASACKDLGDMNWNEIAKGLTGTVVLMGAMTGAMIALSKFAGGSEKLFKVTKDGIFSSKKKNNFISIGLAMIAMAAAMKIMASAAKDFAGISWEGLGKAGAAMTGILALVVGFNKLCDKVQGSTLKNAGSLIILGVAMEIFANICQKFGNMSWPDLGKAGAAIAGILGIVVAFNKLCDYVDSSMNWNAVSLIMLGVALEIFADICNKFGQMDWESLGKAGVAITGILGVIVGFNKLCDKIEGDMFKTAGALLVFAAALRVLTPVLTTLGGMPVASIAKGIISLALALGIFIGAAALVDKFHLTKALYALSGAIAVFGLGCLMAGVGIMAFATGMGMLAGVTVAGATAIVSALRIIIVGILELIPDIIGVLTDAIVALCEVFIRSIPAICQVIKTLILELVKVLVECVPQLAEGALKMVLGVLDALVAYAPQIIDRLFEFLIQIIEGLGRNIPKLSKAFAEMLMSIFQGAIDALKGVDTDTLIKGLACIGFLTAIAIALAGLALLAPLAMVGVLALGAVITELAVVLAAIGKLAEMFPGLEKLVGKSAGLMEAIGNAIGRFIGGIVGGIAEGITSSLPSIADDLSDFMTRLQPFLDGAGKLNGSTFKGVQELVKTIIELTAAKFLDRITSFGLGNHSLTDFAEQLVPFGEAMVQFSDTVSGRIDEGAVTAAANAGKVLTEMAKTIPNSGGWLGAIVGNNDLADFAYQLVPFGEAISEFSAAVSGKIDEGAVTAAANAGKTLTAMADTIPNSGGFVSLFAGDNTLTNFAMQLIPFGVAMSLFSESVKGVDEGAVTAAANAGKALTEMANTVPNCGGLITLFEGDNDLARFGAQLYIFGKAMSSFASSVEGINEGSVMTAATAGTMLAKMADTVPNCGGLISFFTGDNDLATFGVQLVIFGRCISAFSKSISGDNAINTDAVTAAASAGSMMAEMNKTLPKTGGVVSFFTGKQDMTTFGVQLVIFGRCISAFSKSISGDNAINTDAVTAAASAGSMMAELAASLPDIGGLISRLGGGQNLDTFGTQLITFGEGISKFSKSITGENAINADAITAAANAGKALAEIAKTLPDVGGALSKLGGGQNIDTFGGQLAKFGEGIVAFSNAITNDKGGSAINAEAMQSAADVGKKLAQIVSSLPDFEDKDIGTFGTQVKSFGEGIVNFSKEVSEKGAINSGAIESAATVGVKLADVVSKLPDFEDKDIGTFGYQLQQFGRGIVNFSKEVSKDEALNATAMGTAADVGAKLATTAAGLPDIGEKDLGTFGKQLKNFGKGITNFSKEVSGEGAINPTAIESAAKVGTTLANTVAGLPDISEKNLGSFGTQLKEFGKGLKGFSKQISGLDTEALSTKISGINTAISKLSTINVEGLTALTTSIKNAQKNITSAFNNLLKGSITKINSYKSKFSSAGKGLTSSFIKGLKTDSSKISSPFKTPITNAVSTLKSYKNSFHTAGADCAKGFANGIKDNASKAETAATNMAKAAAEAAKKALKINSPSKVFRAIAYSIPEGFAQGIDRRSGMAEDSAVSMAKVALNSTKNAISRISDLINSDIDTQPTIRPVVDLSDVTAGAGAINGLFTMQPSIGVLSRARSISAMMNESQNGDNSDVVSAIKDLGRKIEDSSGDTYNIGDVRYDDDTNISNAVKTLTRAVKIERRT